MVAVNDTQSRAAAQEVQNAANALERAIDRNKRAFAPDEVAKMKAAVSAVYTAAHRLGMASMGQ